MAFTPEQEAAILEFVTKYQAAPIPPAKENDETEPKQPKTVAEQAKEEVEAEKVAASNLLRIESSIKFNLSIADFIEKNKSLLPEESSKILTTASVKNFKDENEKANTVRKGILDSFLSQKENIDCLTPSLVDRANEYKALAESDKEKRSSEFWDLAETGVALKHGKKKAETLNQLNGLDAGDDSKNIIASKILATAKERFKPVQL